MSIILANVWKSRVNFRQLGFYSKHSTIQAMSDRKRTGQDNLNNSNGDEGVLKITIGDVKKLTKTSKTPELVPIDYLNMFCNQDAMSHLRWMLQKDILGQDIFLIGKPGPFRRRLALAYLELTNKSVEFVSLSQDTTEADLKQRREIIGGTSKYINQSAVKAAIEGRVLILDGIEKAERNVLPILNNLLENREIHLEDGRFLVAPKTYDTLLQEHGIEHMLKWNLVRVSEDFFVIALGLPVPTFNGIPLDPPLRSRFQARHIMVSSYTIKMIEQGEDIFSDNYASSSANASNSANALNINDNVYSTPILKGYDYPIEDLQPMLDLLKEWNLECVYQTLLDQLIDLKIMEIMKAEHVHELLKYYPLGIKILFSNKLEKWQKSHIMFSPPTESLPIINRKTLHEKSSASIDINLGDILCDSSTGLMINDYYKTNQKFNDNIRALLVDLIISYIITKQISMSVSLANNMADQVVGLFPTEVKDTYFLKNDTNKNPKGKLYGKYYNSMRTLKTSGLISSTTHAKPTKPLNRATELYFEPENDVQYIVEQIKHDNNCPFPQLENNWKSTTKFRLNDIQTATSTKDIICNWSSYKLPLGYRLVDIDFQTMYPNCPNLISEFELASSKLIDLLDDKLKDTSSRQLFERLKEATDISQNGKNAIILYLLHAIFIPTSKKVTRNHVGKKNQIKYSIKDSQNTFIIFKNSVAEIEEYINVRQNIKTPIQPFIMVVGTPLKPKDIIIFFDNIKYKIYSIVHAVDITFKLFHLFNLEYPPESVLVWLFIQKFFYLINTKCDVPCHTLGQILADLKNK